MQLFSYFLVNFLFLLYYFYLALNSDYYFTCPVNLFAQKLAEHGNRVYNYHFTQVFNLCIFLDCKKNKLLYWTAYRCRVVTRGAWGSWMGVKHGDEMEFTFGHPLSNTDHNYTEAERDLSRKMMKYFTDFAKTG